MVAMIASAKITHWHRASNCDMFLVLCWYHHWGTTNPSPLSLQFLLFWQSYAILTETDHIRSSSVPRWNPCTPNLHTPKHTHTHTHTHNTEEEGKVTTDKMSYQHIHTHTHTHTHTQHRKDDKMRYPCTPNLGTHHTEEKRRCGIPIH